MGDFEFENQEILRLEEFVTGRVIDEILYWNVQMFCWI